MSMMGLYPNVVRKIVDNTLGSEERNMLDVDNPKEMFESTTCIFADLTEKFYISENHGIPMVNVTTQHKTMSSVLSKEDGPIGDLHFEENDMVTNVVEKFSLDQTSHVLMKSILQVKEKWMTACRMNGIEKIPLKTMFLVLDGDAPAAKTKTREMRSKACGKIINYIEKYCEGVPSLKRRKRELMAMVQSKMEPISHEDGNQCVYEGSFSRFLKTRRNRNMIVNHLIKIMTDSFNEALDDVTMYLCVGGHNINSGKNEDKIPTVIKLCGSYNHPVFNILQEKGIPCLEGDVIIPYIWTLARPYENHCCVLTRDSDFLISLAALNDRKLHWTPTITDAASWREFILWKNVVSVCVSPYMNLLPVRRRLEILMHLTMAGCDYVEKFSQSGPYTIMLGLKEMLENTDKVFFQNVNFLKYDNNEFVVFHVNELTERSIKLKTARDAITANEDVFAVRLDNEVYLIKLEAVEAETSLNVLFWYRDYRKKSKANVNLSTTMAKRQSFQEAMKRRLYFLSTVTDTRIGLERSIAINPLLAKKCGYDPENNFSYVHCMKLRTKIKNR
jgi:hypothetical protein